MNMLPRERVLAALNHQETDHVPTALGGGPYGVVDELYLRLVKPPQAWSTGRAFSSRAQYFIHG